MHHHFLEHLNKKYQSDITAFIFDLNGTMIEDVNFHIIIWHEIINQMGNPLSLEDTKKECYGRNEDLLERVFPGKYNLEEKIKIGRAKEERYRQEYLPHLRLIDGLESFMQYHKDGGIKLAIGSAADTANIDFAIDNTHSRHYFDAIIGGENVQISKPHPETFLKCASALHVRPENCIVFEDVPKGVEAAMHAGMKSIVLTTTHEPHEFVHLQEHIIGFGKNYNEIVF
jgi:beta-phosphoglucomutase